MACVFTAAILVALAVPLFSGGGSALASNDPLVPGDDCSNNANVVGQPNPPSGGHSPLQDGSPNVINDVAGPIQAPASNFTGADSAPGQATGAKGQANFRGGPRFWRFSRPAGGGGGPCPFLPPPVGL